jgi:predicted DNA-binding transcriptional regulator
VTKSKPRLRIVRSMSEALSLPRTAERIMESLARAGRFLPVKELVKHVRMSERSVRKHLSLLVRRGLLQRRAVPRGSRKIAYEYSLRPVQDMLNAARDDFARTIQKLESAVRRLGKAKASPKSASSSRN